MWGWGMSGHSTSNNHCIRQRTRPAAACLAVRLPPTTITTRTQHSQVGYEGQNHTSRLVAVSHGAAVWDETFVMAALRPLRLAPLELELYGSNDMRCASVCVFV